MINLSLWTEKDKPLQIVGFEGVFTTVERLQELGFRKGASCIFIGRAPLGGPLLYRLGPVVVALRQEEAQCLLVNPL